MSKLSSSSVSYPSNASHLLLGDDEIAEYKGMSRDLVHKSLLLEAELRGRLGGKLDEHKWKLVKTNDRMAVYRRLPSTMVVPDGNTWKASSDNVPMLLATGKLDGTVEDILYGSHFKSTSEMQLTTRYLNKHHQDGAVLCTVETGTDRDPFAYFGIHWRLLETSSKNILACKRDACVLEYMGIDIDEQGHKYGFHLIKSVDDSWCPPMQDSNIARMRIMLCSIYRQVEARCVQVCVKGVFDLGEATDSHATATAVDFLFSVTKADACAEAKRLTMRILQEDQQRMLTRHRSQSKSLSLHPEDQQDDDNSAPTGNCAICSKQQSFFSKLGATWNRCWICHEWVCTKCYVKKFVFARPQHLRVSCCKRCVLECKQLRVDPRDPFPMLDLAQLSSSGKDFDVTSMSG